MKLLRQKKVLEMTGLKRSSLYNYIALGLFPRPVALGRRAVAWVESEVVEWIESRIRERDERIANDSY
ncbi:AlpA family transcriptional regulator [Pseudomonas sp. PDM23]|uniref:helix-turn-helix transcriptional regulator n=1 Tax=Pseudomonas sp. PDM23 TaxID=2769275 RepID=UPI00177D6FFF|nr:AlpA family transcriptional regulator [Pseudomonas sp. PDM23]MBD9574833.1 AlpA family transcriptional regulator [Pseudomonas sp. PDM23]